MSSNTNPKPRVLRCSPTATRATATQGSQRVRPMDRDDTIRPPMTESASVQAPAAPARTVAPRGSLVAPTIAFAVPVTDAAAGGILLVAALRVFGLPAGFTASASSAAVLVVAMMGAAGAAIGGLRCRQTSRPMTYLAVVQACFGIASLLSAATFRAASAL